MTMRWYVVHTYSGFEKAVVRSLKEHIRNAGMDPDNLPQSDPSKMNFASSEGANAAKAWKDIWGCGQGISAVKAVVPTRELVGRLQREYLAARERLLG